MFNSHWHDYSTVAAGAIVQQSLAPLFNSLPAQLFISHWYNCLTVSGTVFQPSLAWFFNSRWHDSSTFISTIPQQSLAAFFLCWQSSSTVIFTVEESCHVPGIQHKIWLSTSIQNFLIFSIYENLNDIFDYYHGTF